MRSKGVRLCLLALPLVFLLLCLFSERLLILPETGISFLFQEFLRIITDVQTQWLVFLCTSAYCIGFTLFNDRFDPRRRRSYLWLMIGISLAIVSYAFAYSTAARTTAALTFVSGAALGSGIRLWEFQLLRAQDSSDGARFIIISLVAFLTAAALLPQDWGVVVDYRGHRRWGGVWGHPNTYGLLMALSLVLAFGLTLSSFDMNGSYCSKLSHARRSVRLELWSSIKTACFLLAATIAAIGLAKSQSRGAWLSASVGILYLLHSSRSFLGTFKSKTRRASVPRWRYIGTLSFSLVVLVFWHMRYTENVLFRRALSVANGNDFSTYNRFVAWRGALQMIADRPWFGFGWNQSEPFYDGYYSITKLTEGGAIELNLHLLLATTLGLPAFGCLSMYVWLTVRNGKEEKLPKIMSNNVSQAAESGMPRTPYTSQWSRTICRAATLLFLVGFSFNNGLFNLALAAPFWILLQLGYSTSAPTNPIYTAKVFSST